VTVKKSRAFAPGRVNLIGEHTDYNAGLALPFAIAEGVTVDAVPLTERIVQVYSKATEQRDQFDPVAIDNIQGWRAYVRGAVYELASEGVDVRGTSIEIDSDLPTGAGLSSSAALTVALALALTDAAGHQPLPMLTLARVAQRVENDWAGANTGLLDQIASLSGREGHATLIDFQSLTTEPVALRLGDHRLVLLSCGESHSNAAAEGGYNTRRAESQEAANRMRLETLRDATITDLHMLPDTLVGRARHVISENGRVLTAVDALRQGQVEKLGTLLNQSHASLRDDFEVSTPALDRAVEELLEAGALGARMVGGGFGGSVIGLMPPRATLPEGAREVVAAEGARVLA
jgi:galactokinase